MATNCYKITSIKLNAWMLGIGRILQLQTVRVSAFETALRAAASQPDSTSKQRSHQAYYGQVEAQSKLAENNFSLLHFYLPAAEKAVRR